MGGMTLFSLGKAKLSKVRPVEETTTNPGSSGSMGSWMDAAEMDSWSVKLVSDTRELRAIRNLLSTSDAKLLGVGRDVRVAGKHTTLDLVHVWRITKPLKRMVYDGQKAQVMNRILRVEDETKPIVTKFDQVADSLPLHYDSAVNEKILLHGTKVPRLMICFAPKVCWVLSVEWHYSCCWAGSFSSVVSLPSSPLPSSLEGRDCPLDHGKRTQRKVLRWAFRARRLLVGGCRQDRPVRSARSWTENRQFSNHGAS